MQNGTVKWYEDAKKFGFILGDNGTEYFLHKDELEAPDNPPREGDRVQFSVQAHHRGPKAKSVRRLPPSMTATVAPTASPPQTPGGALTHRPLGALEGMAPSRALSNRLGIYLGLVPTKTTESGFELGHALRQSQDFRAGTVELFDYAQGKSTRTPALVLELVRLLAARGITKDP
ncbi:MAG: hypothetical protein RL653_1242, partial [Pseudomonadota bacterium]